jgi:outer membrane protein OmpA-like peptidoglycan-associated protein
MVLKLYKIQDLPAPTQKAEVDPDSSKTIAQRIISLPVGEKVTFHNLYFEKGAAVVLKKSFPALDDLAKELQQNPGLKIRIEGHTDNVGNTKDLMELSWERAEAVKSYLQKSGIHGDRIGTIGFGSQNPVSDNFTEENRSKNRRVEVRLTEK